VALSGAYTDGTEYLILDAGTRTGTFGSVVDTSAFLDFTLDHDKDPNQVWLSVMNVAALPDVAETPNQLAAANALNEQGPGNGLFDAIVMLDADSARHAFDLASGEIHATAQAALLDDARFIREAALDRLRDNGDGAPVALGYADDGPTIATAGAGPRGWARAYGSGGAYRGDGNAAGHDRGLGGFAFGVDGAAGAWRGGLAGGYQAASMDVDDRNSSASASAVQLAAYGAFDIGAFALRVGGALAGYTIDTSRHVLVSDFDQTLTAHYDAWSGQVFGEAAYRARFGALDIEPFVDLVHVAVSTDGFQESGGTAALSGSGASDSVTFAGIGARFGFALPAASGARFNGLVGWQHIFGHTTPTADLAFGGGTPFTVAGVPLARDVLRLEGGFDWAIGPRATLGVSYSGQIGSDVSDHGANARLSVRF
jgi:outer membrane autotransporter protein